MKNLMTLAVALMMTVGFIACNQQSAASGEKEAAQTTTATASTDNAAANATSAPAVKKPEENAVDPNLPKTTVEFDKTVVDFGDITQGDQVSDVVKFTNTGNEPLIISSAKGSCGCTVPEWPKAPIAPGETGEIKIQFSSKGKKGKQTKTVTIQANTDPNPTRLTVKSNILVPEEEAK